MKVLTRFARLGLLLVLLPGCSLLSERAATYEPAAIPPLVVKVQTFIRLPKDATEACAEPALSRAPETDVEAVGAGLQWKGTARCNAMKLCIIEKIGEAGAADKASPLVVEACRREVWGEDVAP